MELDEHWIKGLKAGVENTKHYAVDLMRHSYDPHYLVTLAEKHNVIQQLGYVAETTLEAARLHGSATDRLEMLVDQLPIKKFSEWYYLRQGLQHWAQEVLASQPVEERNQKWRIYSRLSAQDIADWIDLYLGDAHASTPRR